MHGDLPSGSVVSASIAGLIEGNEPSLEVKYKKGGKNYGKEE